MCASKRGGSSGVLIRNMDREVSFLTTRQSDESIFNGIFFREMQRQRDASVLVAHHLDRLLSVLVLVVVVFC